jgi:hypothetical protein
LLGSAGLFGLWRKKWRALALALGLGFLALFALAYFGSWLPAFKRLQPLRFKVPMDLLLVIPSAFAVSSFIERKNTDKRDWAAGGILVFGTAAFIINIIQTECVPILASKHAMILRTRISPAVRQIADWINTETPKGARVLFEESGDETGFAYDGMYLSSFLAHWTGREFIGGPMNYYNDRHHFAQFCSGVLCERDIMSISDEELRQYFKIYNIGAIVAFHSRSIDRLLAMPGFITYDRRQGRVIMLKVHQEFSWFLQGQGKVTADWLGLHVKDCDGPTAILKYHWIEGLRAEPPCEIVPVKLLPDDPIPFIKIINPPREFTLRIKS